MNLVAIGGNRTATRTSGTNNGENTARVADQTTGAISPTANYRRVRMDSFSNVRDFSLESWVSIHRVVHHLGTTIGKVDSVGALGEVALTVLIGLNVHTGEGILRGVGGAVVRYGVGVVVLGGAPDECSPHGRVQGSRGIVVVGVISDEWSPHNRVQGSHGGQSRSDRNHRAADNARGRGQDRPASDHGGGGQRDTLSHVPGRGGGHQRCQDDQLKDRQNGDQLYRESLVTMAPWTTGNVEGQEGFSTQRKKTVRIIEWKRTYFIQKLIIPKNVNS